MPGRWVEHARTFVSWPCCEWPAAPGHLQDARDEWAEVIRTISRFEPVTVIANPGSRDQVLEACGSSVDVAEIPIDDCWIPRQRPDLRRRRRRYRGHDPLRLQRVGRQGAVVGQRRGRRQAAVRAAGHAQVRRADHRRGRRHHQRRRGHRHDHRVGAAQPQPQPGPGQVRRSRPCCATTWAPRR